MIWTSLIDYRSAERLVWRQHMKCVIEIRATEVDLGDNPGIAMRRSQILSGFLNGDAEMLIWCDSDTLADTYAPLVESCRKTRGIVGTLVSLRRFADGVATSVHNEEKDRWNDSMIRTGKPPTLVKVNRTGAALMAIHKDAVVKMAEKLPVLQNGLRPFCMEMVYESNWCSEDVSFCLRAHESGIPIHVDTRVKTQHGGMYWWTIDDAQRGSK